MMYVIPLAAIMVILIVFPWLYFSVGEFKRKSDYFKLEIHRSYSENEIRYWKKQLRLHYLHHIPIVRWFFRKKH